MVGVLTFHLLLPGCSSLKEKRGRLKPLLARLHRKFDVSAAELELLDRWQESVVACALVGNEAAHVRRSLQAVAAWVEQDWPDLTVLENRIEII